MDEIQTKQIELLEAQKVMALRQYELQALNIDKRIASIKNATPTTQ